MAQKLLLQNGLQLVQYGTDGDFGEETREAVLAFQRQAGLETDGVIGSKTWKALLGV